MGACLCCLAYFESYKAGGHALCEACYRLHQKSFLRCQACAALLDSSLAHDEFLLCAQCVKSAVPQQYTVCAVNYHALTSELIRQLKYHKKFFTLTQIISLMSEAITKHYQGRAMPQRIIPVPLHYKKYNQRGFNQSELMAKQLSALFDIELNVCALTRVKATEKLENKTKHQRQKIMKGAFVYQPFTQEVQHIALIDDVYTSGATTKACIKAIQAQHPNIAVDIWCYARTPNTYLNKS